MTLAASTVSQLRKAIEAVERRSPPRAAPDVGEPEWFLGARALDGALPEGGLSRRALHDVSVASPGDGAAATGFLLALLARFPRDGDVLWCQSAMNRREYGGLYGPGLEGFGFPAERLVQVSVRSGKELAWAMEEGVRSASLAAVVGEGLALDFTATRRLSLASTETAVPCLILAPPGPMAASAAMTRWRVSTVPQFPTTPTPAPPHKGEGKAADIPLPLVGRGRGGGSVSKGGGGDMTQSYATGFERTAFHLELLRCRGGRPGSWRMAWDHETHSFHPLSPAGDREFPSQPALSRRKAG